MTAALTEPLLPPLEEPLPLARRNAQGVTDDYARDGWVRADSVWVELSAAGVPLEGARAGLDLRDPTPRRVEVPFAPAWAVTVANALLARHPAEMVEDFVRACLDNEELLATVVTVLRNDPRPVLALDRLFTAIM